jgi:hypothetical protein
MDGDVAAKFLPFSIVVDFVRHFKEEFRIHGFGFLLDGAAAASDANTALLLSQKR